MSKLHKYRFFLLVGITLLTSTVFGDSIRLMIGDFNPPIIQGQWMQGQTESTMNFRWDIGTNVTCHNVNDGLACSNFLTSGNQSVKNIYKLISTASDKGWPLFNELKSLPGYTKNYPLD